eukprot:1569367-Rhodomonas_salina.1
MGSGAGMGGVDCGADFGRGARAGGDMAGSEAGPGGAGDEEVGDPRARQQPRRHAPNSCRTQVVRFKSDHADSCAKWKLNLKEQTAFDIMGEFP